MIKPKSSSFPPYIAIIFNLRSIDSSSANCSIPIMRFIFPNLKAFVEILAVNEPNLWDICSGDISVVINITDPSFLQIPSDAFTENAVLPCEGLAPITKTSPGCKAMILSSFGNPVFGSGGNSPLSTFLKYSSLAAIASVIVKDVCFASRFET